MTNVFAARRTVHPIKPLWFEDGVPHYGRALSTKEIARTKPKLTKSQHRQRKGSGAMTGRLVQPGEVAPDEFEALLRKALGCGMKDCENEAVQCNKCAECLAEFGCPVCDPYTKLQNEIVADLPYEPTEQDREDARYEARRADDDDRDWWEYDDRNELGAVVTSALAEDMDIAEEKAEACQNCGAGYEVDWWRFTDRLCLRCRLMDLALLISGVEL